MADTQDILVLGASYAGLSITHYLAKHVLPQLKQQSDKASAPYRIVVVDPSAKWFPRHMSPRAAASEKLMPDDLMFQDIANGLKQYGEKVVFIQGSAITWDADARKVVVAKSDGIEVTLPYHALVLATGTKSTSPLFSLQGTTHTVNQEALRDNRTKIAQAQTIVLGGGGPAAVETAGELGELLNGSPGWFSSGRSKPKTRITIYTSSNKLLPVLRESVAKQAETYLNGIGAEVIYNTKIASTEKDHEGRTKVTLNNGETVLADVYIPATGLTPMSQYAPPSLLDHRGYIKTNEKTLRVDEAGPRVYAIGDVGSYSNNGILAIYDSVPVLATNLKRDIIAAQTSPDGKPTGPDRMFKPIKAATQIVPVGQSKGVGELFGWRLPSVFVWLIKGRDFMAYSAADTLTGKKWVKESVWRGE